MLFARGKALTAVGDVGAGVTGFDAAAALGLAADAAATAGVAGTLGATGAVGLPGDVIDRTMALGSAAPGTGDASADAVGVADTGIKGGVAAMRGTNTPGDGSAPARFEVLARPGQGLCIGSGRLDCIAGAVELSM